MSAAALPAGAIPARDSTFSPGLAIKRIAHISRAVLRAAVLAFLYPFAVADAAWQRLMAAPSGGAQARARAAWLHRWSRIALRVLGVRIDQRGFTPVSGMVVASYTSLLDAILIAAMRPCVFVGGAEVRRWPIVGLLARLGGTLFVDPDRHNDAARINFMIQRAVQRRMLVVIFPECRGTDGTTLHAFTSAIFQPAAELGCTLTAAAIHYRVERDREHLASRFTARPHGPGRLAHLFTRCRACAIIAFSAPTFRRGNRKQLARELRGEVLKLKHRAASAAS